MKYPLVGITLLYCAGLLLADWIRLPLALLFAVSLVAVVAAAASSRPWVLGTALVFAGGTLLTVRTALVSPFDLRRTDPAPAIVTLRGTLCGSPSVRSYRHEDHTLQRSLAVISARAVRRGTNGFEPAYGKVLATVPGALTNGLAGGQELEVLGVLSAPPGPLAEGLFDYRGYLRRQGIYHQLRSQSPDEWTVVAGAAAPSWGERFTAWAQRILAHDLPERDLNLELLWAMTLGWKADLTGEVYEPFMQSGTMHIFAISGLHIALIAGILVALLRVCRISRAACAGIVLPLIWFYTAATGWQPSAIRSTLMMTIVLGGWALRRPGNLLNSLAAAALVILVWDPQQLFGASFQLSFFVVLSIALLVPPFERVRDRILSHDPMLPEQLVPRWRRLLEGPSRWLLTALAVSLAACLGSLPLIAYYFHLFSPVSLLANLVVVPLSSAALACNIGSLALGAFAPWIAGLLNHSAWLAMCLMVWASRVAADSPFGYCYVPAPGPAEFLIYYGLLIGLLSGWFFQRGRWVWLAVAAVLAAVLIVVPRVEAQRHTQITVLPLSGGFVAYTDAPGLRHDTLIDTGDSNSVSYVTRPFLQARGVNALPGLILTHGDIGHTGGAALLALAHPPQKVYASPVRFRSPSYREALARFREHNGQLAQLSLLDSAGLWTLLHPGPQDQFSLADDNAMVLAATMGSQRILLVSDLARDGQQALLRRGGDLRADILVAGVPVRGEPVCDALLEAARPRLIILADSEYPATQRATPSLCERLGKHGATVVCTRVCGSVTLDFAGGRCRVRAMDGWGMEF